LGSCAGADVDADGTRFDGQTAGAAAKADNAGAFTVNNLAAGQYSLKATKAGYRDATSRTSARARRLDLGGDAAAEPRERSVKGPSW